MTLKAGLAAVLLPLLAPGTGRAQEEPQARHTSEPSLDESLGFTPKDAERKRTTGLMYLEALKTVGPGAGVGPELIKDLENRLAPTEGSFLHLDPGQRPAAGADEGLPEAAQQAQETPSYAREPMSFMDAQTNFQTVVEAKLARESDSGAWPYLEPGSKRPWLLELRKLDVDTIRELDRDRFSGCVLFARREPLAQVDIDFTVDFSGSRWRVSEVRLHSVAAQKKPAPRKRTRKRP